MLTRNITLVRYAHSRLYFPVIITWSCYNYHIYIQCLNILQVVRKAVSSAKHLVDVAQAAVWVAEKVVDNNRWPLDIAIGVLDGARATVKASSISVDIVKGLLEVAKVAVDKSRWDANNYFFSDTSSVWYNVYPSISVHHLVTYMWT